MPNYLSKNDEFSALAYEESAISLAFLSKFMLKIILRYQFHQTITPQPTALFPLLSQRIIQEVSGNMNLEELYHVRLKTYNIPYGWGASAAGGFPSVGDWRLRHETQHNRCNCWVALSLNPTYIDRFYYKFQRERNDKASNFSTLIAASRKILQIKLE